MIKLVCVTQRTRSQFMKESPLALSLKAQALSGLFSIQLYFSSTLHLSRYYNQAIESARGENTILVFIRDDVSFCDHYWIERIRDALERFDIVGAAGNRRILPGQPSWAFVSSHFQWDKESNLCGAMAYGNRFPLKVSRYGPFNQECQLLDGSILAVSSVVLQQSELRFDVKFNQYFFDLDFCRQARKKGLRLGVGELSIARENESDLGGPGWRFSYQKYLEKYHDPHL